MYRQPPLIMG